MVLAKLVISVWTHSQLEIPQQKKAPQIKTCGTFQWYLPESNWGHTDFQSVALPSELRYQPAQKAGAKIRASNSKCKEVLLFFTDNNRLQSQIVPY